MQILVCMGTAGNGVPVFLISGQSAALGRPFGATWDGDRHVWMYPAYYPAVQRVLADFDEIAKSGIVVSFSDTALEYIRDCKDIERRITEVELPSDFTFMTPPYDHQRVGLCHVFYLLRSALFFDPGLGKSKIIIDLMRLLRHVGDVAPVVIMGPLVTIRNWGAEIDRHSANGLRWGAVLGTKKQKTRVIEKAAQNEYDVLLVTYDTAKNFVDLIARTIPYRTIVCDESHRIKSWSAVSTHAAHEIAQKAVRRVIMTGTPTLGNPCDLYGQFKFLGDYFMPEGFHKFKERFLVPSPYHKHAISGYKNLDVLNARTQFLSIRKRKEECLDLPERTFVSVEYDLTKHQAAIYNQLIEEMGIDVGQLLLWLETASYDDVMPRDIVLPHAAAVLNKLFQVCSGFFIDNLGRQLCDTAEVGGCRHVEACVKGGILPYTRACQVTQKPPETHITVFKDNPKLDATMATIDSVLADETHKVIVWCNYRMELDLIEARLKEAKLGYVRVDGSTGIKIQDRVNTFNEDPVVRVYLAQVSTGVGITLNAASYVIYYSLPYSLGSYLQSLDRNYRIGQTNCVTVLRLFGKHTIEYAVARLLDNKVDVDTVLATKLSCIICPRSLTCFAAGISLFDKECIYQKKMVRPTIQARLVEWGSGDT